MDALLFGELAFAGHSGLKFMRGSTLAELAERLDYGANGTYEQRRAYRNCGLDVHRRVAFGGTRSMGAGQPAFVLFGGARGRFS